MRENRQSGSAGGEAGTNRPSLPRFQPFILTGARPRADRRIEDTVHFRDLPGFRNIAPEIS